MTRPQTSQFEHQTDAALELEFYIPATVWNHPATQSFLHDVYALVQGATILGGAKGVWQGQTETTNLVKVIIREEKAALFETRTLPAIRTGIDTLMRAWQTSGKPQEAFMFTVRPLTVHDTRAD